LRYGVALGARLVAGLQSILERSRREGQTPSASPTSSHLERRALEYWARIDRQCRPHRLSSDLSSSWLWEAWQAGPNDARHNLESILSCPVYDEEVAPFYTPLSHPHETLSAQVRQEMKRIVKELESERSKPVAFALPSPADVDSEAWMTMPSEEELRKTTSPAVANNKLDNQALDDMIGGVRSFMKGQSTVEGVESVQRASVNRINPTVFLNILHSTLKAETAQELVFPAGDALLAARPISADPFFSEDDYATMDSDSDSDEGDGNRTDKEMKDLMAAMDEELKGAPSVSRNLDGNDGRPSATEDVEESTHVLSNLLQSLDAGAGTPGPVDVLLKEMGIDPPRVEDAAGA